MSRKKLPPFRLLSTVIPPNLVDGYYPFYQGVWLCYNEAFRRELLRLKRSFLSDKAFDPITHPWHSTALYLWLSDYFLPVVKHHENNKRLIVKPHYEENLHCIIPESAHLDYSETFLQQECQEIISVARELCLLCVTDNLFPQKIRQCIAQLRLLVRQFSELYERHLDNEERYWPAVFEATGLAEWNKMVILCAQNDAKQPHHIGELYFTLVFNALGYEMKLLNVQEDMLDIPWCGAGVRMDIVKKTPFILRMIPAVTLMQRGLKYKMMINSIYEKEEDDLLETVETFRRKEAHRNDAQGAHGESERRTKWRTSFGSVLQLLQLTNNKTNNDNLNKDSLLSDSVDPSVKSKPSLDSHKEKLSSQTSSWHCSCFWSNAGDTIVPISTNDLGRDTSLGEREITRKQEPDCNKVVNRTISSNLKTQKIY